MYKRHGSLQVLLLILVEARLLTTMQAREKSAYTQTWKGSEISEISFF